MKKNLTALLSIVVLVVPNICLLGCSKDGDVGETVPGPPRDLVEKSMPDQMKGSEPATQ